MKYPFQFAARDKYPGTFLRSNSVDSTTSSILNDLCTSSRGTSTRGSSQYSYYHNIESLEELLSTVKSPLTQISTSCPSSLSSTDQSNGKTISRKKSSSTLKTRYKSGKAIVKAALSRRITTPSRFSLKINSPPKLILFTEKTQARAEVSIELLKIKSVNSSQPSVIEGDSHQCQCAIIDVVYDTCIILDFLDSQDMYNKLPNDDD